MTTSSRLTGAIGDRYRIGRELGQGGMAIVYLAHDLRHDRDVAIKVLHPDLGAALGSDRFLTEIKTMAKLQHPCLRSSWLSRTGSRSSRQTMPEGVRHRMRLSWLGFAGIMVLLGCEVQRQPSLDSASVDLADSLRAVPLIDSTIPAAIAGQDGWNYVESATADVMGDSVPERILLTARVEMVRGRPAWDDGQPWQVYVESQDAQRSYLYAQRLQLGNLTMRVTQADSSRKASVLLIEHLPDRLRLLESRSTSTGLALTLLLERSLDPRGEQAVPARSQQPRNVP